MADNQTSIDIFDALSDYDNEVECLTPIVLTQKNEEKSVTPVEPAPVIELESKKKLILERQQSQALLESFDPIVIKPKCPEKIILCVDLSDEINNNAFISPDGVSQDMITVVQNALKIFALAKHAIDSEHEFALVVLQDTAVWVTEFNPDPMRLIKELEETNETMPCEQCDLSSLFDIILREVSQPERLGLLHSNQHIVRAILIYGRSKILPMIKPNCPALELFVGSANFFFDVIFVHGPANESTENKKIEEIYNFFCELVPRDNSYIYAVSNDPVMLSNYMAMLVAHPLQRPPQGARRHSICNKPVQQEDTIII